MKLFEYEGKELMARCGIPVPESVLITREEEKAPLPYPFVLKAQVMTGGRGKAGGVKVCADEQEYEENKKSILHMKIRDCDVHGLLAEKMVSAEREMYLSITMQGVEVPTLIFSGKGGMDIEKTARETPEEIVRIPIDPFTGLKDYQLGYLARQAEVPDRAAFISFVKNVEKAFFSLEAMLVEINPLGLSDGCLIAMDSKIVLDDHGHGTQVLEQELKEKRKMLYQYREPEEEKTTVTFVPLQGDVGLISDGAGTGMLTLDLIKDEGLELSSFSELGGMVSPEVIYRAMELTFQNNPDIRALMIVLIGGFNRMDYMAEGITSYVREHQVKIPIFCRMCGTKQEEGIRIMQENGMETYDILTDTVKKLADSLKGVR